LVVDNGASKQNFRSLRPGDFAKLFGTNVRDISPDCLRLIRVGDFRYTRLGREKRDAVIQSVLKRILFGELTVAGDASARTRWEKGWTENLRNLARSHFSPSALTPKYIRQSQPLRLFQDYVIPVNPRFELNWYKVFTRWLFKKYLSGVDTIYEFGCGSGINVAALARMFPEKKIVGLDWARSSEKIVNELARSHGWNVEGRVFDFFQPDFNLRMDENSALLTIGALEQTGNRYGSFLKYILNNVPAVCVNIEPICEWYDENNLVDYMAMMFHKRRGYWEGFPAKLKELEGKGKVQVMKTKRSYFGSTFIEGYSQIIWKPTRRVS